MPLLIPANQLKAQAAPPNAAASFPQQLKELERAVIQVMPQFLTDEFDSIESVMLYNNSAYIVAVDAFRKDQVPLVPYRSCNYFQVIAMHPGLNPKVVEAVDLHLSSVDPFNAHPPTLAELRLTIQNLFDPLNPYQRPLPLGVSMGLRCGLGPRAQVLAVTRSDQVALNPGILTTPVDEGVQVIHNFPSGYLREGLSTELHVQDEPLVEAALSEPRLLGLTFPVHEGHHSFLSQGAVSGANALYDSMVDAEALSLILDHVSRPDDEIANAQWLTVDEVVMRDDVSHTLKEYAIWVMNGGD